MMVKSTGIVCMALSVVLTLTAGAFAQTGTSGLGGLTPEEQRRLLSLLGSGGLGDLSGLLGGGGLGSLLGTGTDAAASQPAISERVGPPRTMISAAIGEHLQFNNVGFNMTPAQQAEALGIEPAPVQIKIPIIFLFKGLIDLGARYIPALEGLRDLLAGITWPGTGNNGDIIPPTSVTDKGLVAYVTADDTSLRVGQTTTGRLWVEQTSPNTARDNGVFSVGVDIVASPAGIILSTAPVTLVSPWDVSLAPTIKGTATADGSIIGIGSAQGTIPADRTRGIGEPMQVANWQITAKAPGTVTLTAENHIGDGYNGINPIDSSTSPNGDEANYVPVEITVTQ